MPSSPAKIIYQKALRIRRRPEMLAYGIEYYKANRDHLLDKQRGYDAKKQLIILQTKGARDLFKVLPFPSSLGVF